MSRSACGAATMPSASHCSRRTHASSRSICLAPPFHALRLTLALPSMLRGPVAFCHGFHRRMASRCCWRCSSVQIRAAIRDAL